MDFDTGELNLVTSFDIYEKSRSFNFSTSAKACHIFFIESLACIVNTFLCKDWMHLVFYQCYVMLITH